VALGGGSFECGFVLFRFFTHHRFACTGRLEAEPAVELFAEGFASAGAPVFSRQTLLCAPSIRGSAEQIASVVARLAPPVLAWATGSCFHLNS
jgi:hypothetical protein